MRTVYISFNYIGFSLLLCAIIFSQLQYKTVWPVWAVGVACVCTAALLRRVYYKKRF